MNKETEFPIRYITTQGEVVKEVGLEVKQIDSGVWVLKHYAVPAPVVTLTDPTLASLVI